MTNYRQKYLRDTINALNTLIERKRNHVDTKAIRRELGIPSSNRSATNFLWRSLKELEKEGYIVANGRDHPKRYVIAVEKPIECPDI